MNNSGGQDQVTEMLTVPLQTDRQSANVRVASCGQ